VLRRVVVIQINGLSNVNHLSVLLLEAAAHNNYANDQADSTSDCADDGTDHINS
jgi:hypothetical protein